MQMQHCMIRVRVVGYNSREKREREGGVSGVWWEGEGKGKGKGKQYRVTNL